ncbi:CPBP family intramembrane glutamic endopeptidase [Planomonospora parontospora]|uniref:CPBP family intramembrane glutamic endopeptidase n=1 Tax=Planomonospora parontospora TaxID=58119 RepID=UPI00167119B0|nr:CPBP family intramembrane glutamic endopeptidase [Planomonospora parontospora]GGL04131.1 abortive infection protein [Planomonospora parontospora subsp. antibiotica]GII13443.1 abortive infection protein [Planomonospora parontospora subsp. antibiotica]
MPRRPTDLWVFLSVAFGLSWLIASPLWLGGVALGSPAALAIGLAMMSTPALGALAVRLYGGRSGAPRTSRREWAAGTGLTLGERRGRTAAFVALAWLGTPLLVVAATAVSAALGLLSLDLDGLSLFRQTLAEADPGRAPAADPHVLVAAQLAVAVLVGPLTNTVAAFGEEWGWRGWLLPRLMPLGTARALLLSGVIWGAWHAPLTLLGYNYPALGAWAAPFFIVFCVPYGALLGWLRLYSGSVWPAAVGHGALNATAGVPLLLGDAAAPPDLVVAGITGLVGSALLAAVSAVLLRRWPVRRPAVSRSEAAV